MTIRERVRRWIAATGEGPLRVSCSSCGAVREVPAMTPDCGPQRCRSCSRIIRAAGSAHTAPEPDGLVSLELALGEAYSIAFPDDSI